MPNRRADVPIPVGELPAPSTELTLAAVMLRAHLRTLKPKARQRYLRSIAETLADFEAHSSVVRIRGREHDEAVALSRREAAAWLRATLGAFFVADGER
jgi:hypothetical protein